MYDCVPFFGMSHFFKNVLYKLKLTFLPHLQVERKKEGFSCKDKKSIHTEYSNKEEEKKKKRKILDHDLSEKICTIDEPFHKKEKKILKEETNSLKRQASSSRTSG
jgi:hypothetical protein